MPLRCREAMSRTLAGNGHVTTFLPISGRGSSSNQYAQLI